MNTYLILDDSLKAYSIYQSSKDIYSVGMLFESNVGIIVCETIEQARGLAGDYQFNDYSLFYK